MNPWLPLAVTLSAQAVVSMALLVIPVMATAVARALDVSPTLAGLYVAVVYAGAMTASLCAGTAVTRFGPVRVSQTGLLLCAGGLVLSAVPVLPAVAAGAFLLGLGYGPLTPASSHLLARTTPADRISLVFSIKQTGVPLGGVLAGATVPSLLLAGGWQVTLLVAAAVNLLCAAAIQPVRRTMDADRQPGRPLALGQMMQPIKLVLSQPALVRLAACSFVFSTTQLSLTTYLVTYLHDSLAYGLVAAGLALSASQFGGIGGRIFWGYLADRWLSARGTLAMLAALMALGTLATAWLPPGLPMALVLVVLVVFSASAVGWNGVYLAEVARQAPPGLASTATGGTLAITFLGVVLGPPLFGAVSASFGSYRAGFAALALPTALCCVALLARRPAVQRRAVGAE